MGALKILCVHGLGGHVPGDDWEVGWRESIKIALSSVSRPVGSHSIEFAYYDDIFADYEVSFVDSMKALGELLASGAAAPFRSVRGVQDALRMTAGMVVAWVEDDEFRRRTRERLVTRVDAVQPDVVLAHSLGSLIAYDTFSNPDTSESLRGRTLVTLGSQIGNPFVVGNFLAGKVEPLPQAKTWFHLYNEEDDVFTAPLNLYADNFRQIETFFDIDGFADHTASEYIAHKNAIATLWTNVSEFSSAARGVSQQARSRARLPAFAKAPQKRALLIGVNEYSGPVPRLEGCVNDVYLMSAALQESGFSAEDIRIVLNDRATAAAIRERVDWLFDGVRGDDTRVLYFSGHGAQLPTYGLADTVDQMDETLVPHDFDWSKERAFTDDEFYTLYSQLPYDAHVLAMFDCCHSGGLVRATGPAVRGIDPPDDIRHRTMYWDSTAQLWKPRDLSAQRSIRKASMNRLGYGTRLRAFSRSKLDKAAASRGHKGPYMPVLLFACQEQQVAYEYSHGSVPHGAFTFCFVKNLRREIAKSGATPTFRRLMQLVNEDIAGLGFDQDCVVEGPKDWVDAPVPLLARATRKRGK